MRAQTPATTNTHTAGARSPQPGRAPKCAQGVRLAAAAVIALALVITAMTSSSTISAQVYGPSAPLNLEATVVSATQIDLTWERPTHVGSYPPITGYRIWVSTGPSSAWTRTVYNTETTATAYSHTGLFFGDYRRYRVAGLDKDLNEGPQSNIAFATISGPAAPPLAARPGLSEVTLTWTPPDDDSEESILKYQVRHRGVGGNYSSWEDIDGAAQARTHTVINLNRGTIYDFQVRAVDHIGPGDEGYVQETTLTLADVTTPINLTAAAAYKEVTLTWDSPIDTSSATVEKYQVRHAEIDGAYGTWTDATGGAETRTHTVTGLTNFQKYRFQVQAVTTLGTTPDPPEVEAIPLDFGMWVTNHSIKRGSNVVGERKTPVYVYAPATIVKTDTVFTLTWGGRPTDELHPDNPTTVTIRAGEHIGWSYLWAAADEDSPPVYNQPVKQDVVARLGTLKMSDPLIVFDDEPLPVVKLSAPATVAEGETFKVTATLQHRLDVDTTVPINMVNLSQMNIRDSAGVFGWPYPSISIPKGQLTGQTDTVHKQQDNDEDGYGDLYFGVNGISPAQWWPSHDQATVRVTDDDTNNPNKRRYAGWPRLYMGDAWADESGDPDVDTTITFSITLYPTSRSEITVDYQTMDGSAKAGVNYRAKSGTLTFAPREKHKTVVVEVMDDGQGPGTTFQLVANGPHGGGAEVGNYWVTGRIYDETPTFRSWPESARESGNGNPTHMSFYVSLVDFNKEGTYTIDYATVDGTATAGTDYTHTAGTLTFEPGEPGHQLVHVPILDDSFADSGETFSLVLSNPTGGSQLNRWHHTVTGTINDNDNTPAVSARFPNSADTSTSHTGTDDRPQIVVAFSEPVASFTKTTPSVSVTNAAINAVQAHTEEGLENAYIFTLKPAGDDDIGFILTNDAGCNSGGICSLAGTKLLEVPPTFTITGPESAKRYLNVTDAADADEQRDKEMTFAVTLNDAAVREITVDYETADGTATAAKDYTPTSGTLTFNPGETVKAVLVPIINDQSFDPDETLRLIISNPSGAEITDDQGVGTIIDDEPEPDPLRALFVALPEQHYGTDFWFLLDTNGIVDITENDMRDHAFTIIGGTITEAAHWYGIPYIWQIAVLPDSGDDITITLPGQRDCAEPGAICSNDEIPLQLSNSPSATVTGPNG